MYRRPTVRLSQMICPNQWQKKVLVFPDKDVTKMMLASEDLNPLTGFDTGTHDTGTRICNFILNNGDRTQRKDCIKKVMLKSHTHMMPEGCYKKIRSVGILHSKDIINGFSFRDKDGVLIWNIGRSIWAGC